MLSHLRFHRRGASNPASPTTEPTQQSWSTPSGCEPSTGPDAPSPFDALPLSARSAFALPPTLPPITRVTSTDSDLPDSDLRDVFGISSPECQPRIQSNGPTGFIGGIALQNYRRDVEAHLTGASPQSPPADAAPQDTSRRQPHGAVLPGPEMPPRPTARHTTSSSTPAEVLTAAPTMGHRPAGTRLPSDASLSTSTSHGTDPPRSRKSLPFLKNPMSTLLMRRKVNHNVPDIRPLPLSSPKEEPVYDPRIRGTRIHDFSAPRRKHHASNHESLEPRSPAMAHADAALARDERASIDDVKDIVGMGAHPLNKPNSISHSKQLDGPGADSQLAHLSPTVSSANFNPPSVVGAPSVEERLHDNANLASQTPCSAPMVNAPDEDTREARLAHPSTRTTRSGNVSLSDTSALPKHMRSTSSRFSFDMIGAAKQEKLLEERHRKRQLERKHTGADAATDSRFDDFDEDAFDYDVMMDDEGLEEKIPGINAELGEDGGVCEDAYHDELDPDDDQENFAGFVFQRSNPTSSSASPQGLGIMTTPRDDTGKVIGFAMTKDTLSSVPGSPESQPMSLNYALSSEVSGLGSRAPVEAFDSKQYDDFYFDDGFIDQHGEFAQDLAMEPEYDTAPFDESIFDNNDTDQFGRPVPGAFAQAQGLRLAAAQDQPVKRESDLTSRFSAHSGTSRSTAHTSPCEESRKGGEVGEESSMQAQAPGSQLVPDVKVEFVAEYQAALAAAAHEAAASGKFHRCASPQENGDEQGELLDDSEHPAQPNDWDDSGFAYDEVDGLGLEDDAIIAEANASALASDADEWYGQEFGFYSNPVGLHQAAHSGGSAFQGSEYEYANGGFFGPKGLNGLDRSTSGRMISREPNLTPITERSEYSNRNSVMSMGFPPLSSSTPMIQSPGLAHLALMTDRGDEHMTLSALLRLRSKAWGGSQASLPSSRDGSPLSDRGDMGGSPWSLNVPGQLARSSSGHGRKNSFLSTASRDSEGPSAPGSPTLTMSMPVLSSPCPMRASSVDQHACFFSSKPQTFSSATSSNHQREQSSGLAAKGRNEACPLATSRSSSLDVTGGGEAAGTQEPLRRPGRSHHRHNSSADSVSYLREEDCGETRWIMERRRMSESGEVEILEREVVEGGRI